jgi:hypothetical protein
MRLFVFPESVGRLQPLSSMAPSSVSVLLPLRGHNRCLLHISALSRSVRARYGAE